MTTTNEMRTREKQIFDYNFTDFDDSALVHIINWVGNQPPLCKNGPDFPCGD